MYPKSFQALIQNFSSLPSIGPKMAERLVLHLFKKDSETLTEFANNLEALTKLSQCERCFHIAEGSLCLICQDKQRDPSIICVVEDTLDVIAIEKTHTYNGVYHVLGGVIEPSTNAQRGENLTLSQFFTRIQNEPIQEVILATNPTSEGDLTALYIRQKLKSANLKITRLARGLSTGGDIEYADEETLSSSLSNRQEYR